MKTTETKIINRLKTMIINYLHEKEKSLKESALEEDWPACLRTEGEISALEEIWTDLDNI